MNYEEAVAYIEETPKFTTKNKLEHTKECLRRLGSPEERFKVIHVAGTNGKGSTCAFLTSILREAGYSCGLFTSPHLVVINERFQINEKNIDDDTFLHAFEKVKKLADELVAEGSYHPTYFEFLFLMGMVIFADAGVDYVVLETGLGGKLDATTAVEHPLACVITSISFDHMQYLGNTITAIAGEKAGIIVPGVPVIYDGNDAEAAKVISERAQELGSPYYEVKREDAVILRNTMSGIDFSFKNEYYGNTTFSIPFIAKYQVMNSMLALKTIEVMKNHISVSEDAVCRGVRETRWQGRMETVLPGVIVDGAHNEDGVEKFVETAAHFQKEYPLTLLLLCLYFHHSDFLILVPLRHLWKFPASVLHFRCLPGLLHCPLHPHLQAGLACPDLRYLYQNSGHPLPVSDLYFLSFPWYLLFLCQTPSQCFL